MGLSQPHLQVGDAEREQLQRHAGQRRALYLRLAGRRQRLEGCLGVQPEGLARRLAACSGRNSVLNTQSIAVVVFCRSCSAGERLPDQQLENKVALPGQL